MEDVIKKNLETLFSLAAVTYSMCDDSTNPLYTQILEKVMNVDGLKNKVLFFGFEFIKISIK